MACIRSLATQSGQTRGRVRGQAYHAAQPGEIERFADERKNARDHKPATGFLHNGIVNSDDKCETDRPNGRNLSEIREHSIAFEALNMIDFGSYVFDVRAGNKTSFAADDAHSVALLNFYDHGLL
jgi:hypothetical protein